MSIPRLHADEFDLSVPLARTLLAEQHPQWAQTPLTPIASAGTDNVLLRLDGARVLRLPRTPRAAVALAKELLWLPRLAPHLPLPIPQAEAVGAPSATFPAPWAIYRWLEGDTLAADADLDMARLADDLAAFVQALRSIDAAGGPTPGAHNVHRGEPLAGRDAGVRSAAHALRGRLDVVTALAVWQAALAAPPWSGPPRWLHGDLIPPNLLVRDGRLAAVIDFGCLAVGDPAYDLTPAWHLLPAPARARFRAQTQADAAAWTRARGLALSGSLIAFPYYETSNPALAAVAWRTIHAVLDDWRAAG